MLDVYLFNSRVGVLAAQRGRLGFTYAASAIADRGIAPLSVRLPQRAEPYDDDAARSFFENLLPEEECRRILAATLRISERDSAGLLGAVAGECAGAVSLWPENTSRPVQDSYKDLAAEDLAALFAVPDDVKLAEAQREGRLSLAGAQSKLALRRSGAGWQLPLKGSASTHILKRTRVDVPHLVENEFFCMRLAALAGLPVPEVEYLDIGIPLLVVRRFDRVERDNAIERVHQEDLCQATGTVPADKYEADGGPGLATCARVIREHSALPIADLLLLAGWVAFNYLIGNEDAHGKNVALIHTAAGLRLAPFYDLVSSIVYQGLSRKAAMGIGGERRFGYVERRHWNELANALELPEQELRRVALETADSVVSGLDRAEHDAAKAFGEIERIAAIAHGARERAGMVKTL